MPGQPVSIARVAAHRVVMPAPGHALRTLIDRAAAQAQADIDIAVQANSISLQESSCVAATAGRFCRVPASPRTWHPGRGAPRHYPNRRYGARSPSACLESAGSRQPRRSSLQSWSGKSGPPSARDAGCPPSCTTVARKSPERVPAAPPLKTCAGTRLRVSDRTGQEGRRASRGNRQAHLAGHPPRAAADRPRPGQRPRRRRPRRRGCCRRGQLRPLRGAPGIAAEAAPVQGQRMRSIAAPSTP